MNLPDPLDVLIETETDTAGGIATILADRERLKAAFKAIVIDKLWTLTAFPTQYQQGRNDACQSILGDLERLDLAGGPS